MNNYAQTYHIGKNQHSRRARTTKTAPTIGRVCKVASKTKDSKRNSERQTEIRTDSNASNAFLKCRFLPKQEEIPTIQDSRIIARTERDFYKSLSNLSKIYNIEPMQTKNFEFPYNLALAVWDLESKMELINEGWTPFKLMQNNKKCFFAKEERFYTNTLLYYIPIVPLFQMLNNKQYKKNAQLLLSVCSYLYKIVDVPYYKQQNSYLYWIYEMHEEWIEQGDETEENLQEYKREFRISKTIGDKIEKKLFNSKNLECFEQRLNHFESHTAFDHDCYKVASEAFALYSEYPKTSIFRNKPTPEQDPYSDDYSNNTIGMHMYISFVADTKGCLYSNIEESINTEFNEYGSFEEPTIYTPINGTSIAKADFDFENRIFTLLEELYSVLTLLNPQK